MAFAQAVTEMVTFSDFPADSVPLDGLTVSLLLVDADHFKADLPSLVSVTTHDQRPAALTAPVALVDEQFESSGGLKLVGLADNFGGVGVGVGFGFGVGVGLGFGADVGVGVGGSEVSVGDGVGVGVGVGVGKAVTTRATVTCTCPLPVLIPNVAE